MAFTHQLRVRFGECDPQGIVFNAHYLAYADIALTEFQRAAFGSYAAMIEQHGVDLVVAEARLRYRAPARFDDLVDITLTLGDLTGKAAAIGFTMTREAAVLVDGELQYVFVDPQTWRPQPIPDALRDSLSRLLAPAAGGS